MHLMKRILPYIARQALLGRTWAGQNVYDSPSDIANIRITSDEKAPFIAIYCDEWDLKSPGIPDEMQATTPGAFKLIIEVGTAQRMTIPGDQGDGETTEIAATDEGLEWQNAFISRQAGAVLTRPGPSFPWSNLFLSFIGGKMLQYAIRRGGPANDGNRPAPRYASVVSIMKVSTICGEPELGQRVSPDSFPLWQELLSLMATPLTDGDPDSGIDPGLAKLLRAHFDPVGPDDIDVATEASAKLWLDERTVASIGLAPFVATGYVSPRVPSAEPARGDVPIDATDMQQWLNLQGPDASQGPPNGRR